MPRKPGTVVVLHGIELAILSGKHEVLPAGQEGEICIRGPNVTSGYLQNPKANEEAFAGGWFHTGDQGVLDKDGYLTITGRIKELINRGGEKISPLEVDAVLLAHPAIAEAISFGVPDAKYGEEVNAAVVLESDQDTSADDIITFAKSRIADFKAPKRLFIVESIPKTATGKIQRRHVAAKFVENRGS